MCRDKRVVCVCIIQNINFVHTLSCPIMAELMMCTTRYQKQVYALGWVNLHILSPNFTAYHFFNVFWPADSENQHEKSLGPVISILKYILSLATLLGRLISIFCQTLPGSQQNRQHIVQKIALYCSCLRNRADLSQNVSCRRPDSVARLIYGYV